MSRLLACFFLLFTLTSPLFLTGSVNQKHDKQIWASTGVAGNFTEKLSMNFTEELRWGNDCGKLYFQLTQLTFAYDLTHYLELSGGFRNVSRLRNSRSGTWFHAYSALARATFFFQRNGWTLSSRNWIQKEWVPSSFISDFWLYRNKIVLQTPVHLITKKMPFYIYDEVFFVQGRGFSQNRFAGGVALNWTPHTTGYIEGMYRRLKTLRGWVPETVFNLSLSFQF